MNILDFKESAEQIEVAFRGEVNIQNAAETKDLLVSLQSRGKKLLLCLEELGEADVSCLQLLCSLHRTSMSTGQPVEWTGNVSPGLRNIIEASGFKRERSCMLSKDQSCLWIGR